MESTGQKSPIAGSGLQLAFRPVYDQAAARVYAYEALVIGPEGEMGEALFALASPRRRADLDRRIAIAAVYGAMAAGLGETNARLLIPIYAAGAADPDASASVAIQAGQHAGLSAERMIFGVHGYSTLPGRHLAELVDIQRKAGSLTAFIGLGHDPVGISPCVRYMPAMVRLDGELVNGIDGSWSRRLMLEELLPRLRHLGLRIIADGISDEAVLPRLRRLGILYVQGDAIAAPEANGLPVVSRIAPPAVAAYNC